MNEDTRASIETDSTGGSLRKFFQPSRCRFHVNVAGASHVGRRRTRNEDHYAILRRTRRSELVDTNLPECCVEAEDDEAWALLVADGVGGARFGDIASQLALETILDASRMATSWLMRFRDFDAQQVDIRVAAYLEEIQERFIEYGVKFPAARQMGTTLTAVYLLPPHAIVVQVGDSRAFLFRDGQLQQLTRDQTLSQLLIERGASAEHARKFVHVLLNHLGGGKDNVTSEILPLEMQSGDRLLVCTDGLTDMVENRTIAEIVAHHDVDESVTRLINAALQRGGRDNVTVVLGEVLDEESVAYESGR
jgi:protein phosphatase